jgi:hypothetical protein
MEKRKQGEEETIFQWTRAQIEIALEYRTKLKRDKYFASFEGCSFIPLPCASGGSTNTDTMALLETLRRANGLNESLIEEVSMALVAHRFGFHGSTAKAVEAIIHYREEAAKAVDEFGDPGGGRDGDGEERREADHHREGACGHADIDDGAGTGAAAADDGAGIDAAQGASGQADPGAGIGAARGASGQADLDSDDAIIVIPGRRGPGGQDKAKLEGTTTSSLRVLTRAASSRRNAFSRPII